MPSLVVALHPSKEIGADDYPVTAEVVEQHHRGRQRQELEHEGVGQRFGLHPSWFGNESTSHEGVELRKRVQHGGIGQMQLKGRRWLLGDTLPWLVLALKRKAMVQDVLAAPLEDERHFMLPCRRGSSIIAAIRWIRRIPRHRRVTTREGLQVRWGRDRMLISHDPP